MYNLYIDILLYVQGTGSPSPNSSFSSENLDDPSSRTSEDRRKSTDLGEKPKSPRSSSPVVEEKSEPKPPSEAPPVEAKPPKKEESAPAPAATPAVAPAASAPVEGDGYTEAQGVQYPADQYVEGGTAYADGYGGESKFYKDHVNFLCTFPFFLSFFLSYINLKY